MNNMNAERLNLCYFGDTLMTKKVQDKCEVAIYLLDEFINPVIKVTDAEKGESSAPVSCYKEEVELALTLAEARAMSEEMT
jgi:hypothetical protein